MRSCKQRNVPTGAPWGRLLPQGFYYNHRLVNFNTDDPAYFRAGFLGCRPAKAALAALTLTIRTFVKRFARLSLGFSKKLEYLAAAVAVHVAHFNFCWRPRTMPVTPAMKAGVVKTLWDLEKLYERVTE